MVDWKDFTEGWIQEGYFVSFYRDGVRFYEHILFKDLAHWEYEWPESITAGSESGPFTPDDLEITLGYDTSTNTNQIWQMIFGIQGQAYIYVELPTDIHRHGIPKSPKPSSSMRKTSHYEEWMSPFNEPTFLSEHIMMRPDTQQITFSAYNPNTNPVFTLRDLKLNIFINKMITERIGTEGYSDDAGIVLTPSRKRFEEVLGKLYKRTVACRPLTLTGVRAPAVAPGGH